MDICYKSQTAVLILSSGQQHQNCTLIFYLTMNSYLNSAKCSRISNLPLGYVARWELPLGGTSVLCWYLLPAICKEKDQHRVFFVSKKSQICSEQWRIFFFNKTNKPVLSHKIVKKSCNFHCADFLPRAHPTTSSEKHEVWM
uniref:Uncharacterized protein n=1 Tax=Oryza brachyantha TaxID=4533 RepID=J3LQN5_ORYBR